MMIRFDYTINEESDTVNVTVVTERENSSTLCGKLVMDQDSWDLLTRTISIGLIESFDAGIIKSIDQLKFNNKGEKQ